MKTPHAFSAVLSAVLVAFAAAPALAANVFNFSTQDGVTNFDVDAGGTVAVNVLLLETFDSEAELSILDSEGGLAAAGVAIEHISACSGDSASILDVADILPDPAFDDVIFLLTQLTPGGGGSLDEGVDFAAVVGVLPDFTGPNSRSIPLGIFTFTAGLVPGEVTGLSIGDNDPQLDSTVTFDFITPLDSQIGGFDFTISVNPVVIPLPAAAWMGLGLLAAMGIRTARALHR